MVPYWFHGFHGPLMLREREKEREREACFHMFFSNIGSSNRLGHGASKRGTWTHGEVLQQPKVVDLAKDQSSR